MNDVVDTIKDGARCPHHTVSFGKRQNCGHGFIQDQEVKPDADDWQTALVVRDGDGLARRYEREPNLWCGFVGWDVIPANLMEHYGPITVILDANGRNVEAESEHAEKLDTIRALLLAEVRAQSASARLDHVLDRERREVAQHKSEVRQLKDEIASLRGELAMATVQP